MRVAAIDCGTNSIRLLIADVADGKLSDVSRRMEIVRLGEGVDRTGRLAPEAIERTRKALLGYAMEIAELGVGRVRMCATSASRDAANAADFTTMVRATLGVDPEVITGDEEARLSFAGAVTGLTAEQPYLVVDIGGGSTEFVVGGAEVQHAISMDIGCVRLTERHLHSDPPTLAEVAAAEEDITKAVDTALRTVSGHGAATLVGLAGSVTTVAALALHLPGYDAERIHHARIPYDDVARVTRDLLGSTVADRRELPGMHPGRADVIGAGALILRIIMDRARKASVIASEHDILDGIAFSLADPEPATSEPQAAPEPQATSEPQAAPEPQAAANPQAAPEPQAAPRMQAASAQEAARDAEDSTAASGQRPSSDLPADKHEGSSGESALGKLWSTLRSVTHRD